MGRLIDADVLIEAINKSTLHWGEHLWKQVVRDIIYNQPTTYDIEKVVAELEEYKQSEIDFREIVSIQNKAPNSTLSRTNGRIEAFGSAIEIVKRGGVKNG